jgi:hypothetical protein
MRGRPKVKPKISAVKKAPPALKVIYLKRLKKSPPSEKTVNQ